MKLSSSTATLILVALSQVQAAPASFDTSLTKRETSLIESTIVDMNSLVEKRDTMSLEELTKRESQIVTDILRAIKDTGLAPGILKYFITDPQLKPIVTKAIIAILKSGLINLDTLLKALNDSGLAVSVIQNLINDCSFYADIYKLALGFIADLPGKILGLLQGKSKRELEEWLENEANRSIVAKRSESTSISEFEFDVVKRDGTQDILTSLMESLKNSGLADQVVRQLITDPDFLSFGADLITQILKENAISLPDLLKAIIDSGLVPSLIKAFLNIKTFQTVITNALAAAFGRCDGSSVTATITGSATNSATGTLPSGTGKPTGVCRKKKRSYNY